MCIRDSYSDDPYEENALSKMMIRMRLRWDEVERIKENEPGLYIDTVREIQKLMQELIASNATSDGDGSGKDDYIEAFVSDDLSDSPHDNKRDGHDYFGIDFPFQERVASILDDLVKNVDPFGDPPLIRLKDWFQNYFRSSFDRYYSNKTCLLYTSDAADE